MNIAQYFENAFGAAPNDPSLKDLPVFSNCGLDCKKVIDRAGPFYEAVDSCMRSKVRDVAEEAVLVFWVG